MEDLSAEISERIGQIIEYKGVSKNEFAKSLKYDRSQSIYDIMNKKSKPSYDFFFRLANSEYSDIFNLEWVISGKGNMIKDDINTIIQPNNISNNNDIYNNGIPLIPVEAMGGWGTGDMTIMEYNTQRYYIPEFNELNVDFMIRVKGGSMYPKYNSGDIVACKKLPIDTFFQWNKVYVLDTIQGAMIKRIKQSERDNCITCVSDNLSYDPFDLSLKEVHAIALVVGVIRLE